jgi:hypothetical protein
MNQHTLFFILFHYHASACFELIFSPSSGGQVYNVAMVLLLLLKRLSAGLDEKELPIQARRVTLKVKEVPLSHYTLALQMMGKK